MDWQATSDNFHRSEEEGVVSFTDQPMQLPIYNIPSNDYIQNTYMHVIQVGNNNMAEVYIHFFCNKCDIHILDIYKLKVLGKYYTKYKLFLTN